MRQGFRWVLAAAILLVTTRAVPAGPYREGLIASTGKDGGEVTAFAFVECHGRLMFEFAKDDRLSEIKLVKDGSLIVTFNGNKSKLTILPDGEIRTKKGKPRKWRIVTQSELIGPLAKRMVKAKEKCK